jgi:hypothetical protein
MEPASYALTRDGPSACAGTNYDLRLYSCRTESSAMPAWMEIVLSLIGYGGFIAIATYHRSPGKKLPDQDSQ